MEAPKDMMNPVAGDEQQETVVAATATTSAHDEINNSPIAVGEKEENKLPTPDVTGGAPVRQAVDTRPFVSNKTMKEKKPWKFNMDRDLSNAQLSKLPGEEVLASWKFRSTSMSQTEWIATILTCGFYYFCTRILLKRVRNYSIHISDKSILVKEEMFEEQFGCMNILMENQVTFPIKSLAYVCVEETQSRLCNLMPASVALEMRFGRYPKDSEVPETTYQSLFQIFIKPFADASKFALKNAFGIDFDSNPIQLATQIMAAAPHMMSMHGWILFGAFFGLSLLKQVYLAIFQLLKVAMLDPSVGPRMVIGLQDATAFRLEVDISEDIECRHHMNSILQAIAKYLPDKQIVRDTLQPRVRGSILRIPPGSTPRPLNTKRTYEQGDEYVILEDHLFLPTHETIFDACQCNPYLTSSDWKRIIFSLGLYYFTDLAGHINHRKNMFFTNLRCIHHSVLLSPSGTVEHSRLEYWINDSFTNMAVVDFKKKSSFRATAQHFGWISFELTTKNKACMMFVFRSMFRARYDAPKTPGLTFMTQAEWRNDVDLKGSTLTATCLTETESIDCAIYSKQYLYTMMEYLLGCCCLLKVPQATVTATDEVLYIEQYSKNLFETTRLFVCLPWCDVDGIYWQNFDARGPTSSMYCAALCVLCCFFPCAGYFACIFYCASCCASAPENYETYDDSAYGQKGARVRICAAKNASFFLGINLPTKYYGMRHTIVNAMVDAIVSRSLKCKNMITAMMKGEEYASSSHALVQSLARQSDTDSVVKQYTSESVGNPMAAIHQLTQQVSNESGKLMKATSSSKIIASSPPPAITPPDVAPVARGVVLQGSPTPAPIIAQPVSVGNTVTEAPYTVDTEGTTSPIIVQGYAMGETAAASPSSSSIPPLMPVHYSKYNQFKARISGGVSTGPGMGMAGLNFPMNPPTAQTYQSLMPGERILGGWRFETSLLETWQLIFYICTMGIGFFIHSILHQYRTFTSIYVTQDRILIQEEVFNQEYCCTTRIMEDEVSFLVADISYINVVEVGARWCGIIPARTWLEIRFGQHPPVTEDPPGLGSFPSLSGKSNKSMWTKAVLHAMATVYGIKEMDNPSEAMHAYLAMSRDVGVLSVMINMIHFAVQFTYSVSAQFTAIMKSVLWWCIFGSQTEDHAVGPKLVNGTLNGRRHFVGFQTSYGPNVAKELIALVTQLNASKTNPMIPSAATIKILTVGERFDFITSDHPAATSSTQEINDTNTYAAKQGIEFHILQRLWSLLSDEIVYDVTPANPKIVWSCETIYYLIITAGLYYFFILWPLLQYKKSYMITNRRLIRHIIRSTTCLTKYSHLEMWFLSPINSYTVVEKSPTCCKRRHLEFVTDSSRFGPFTFFIRNGDFMKSVLKVVSGGMKTFSSLYPPHLGTPQRVYSTTTTNQRLTKDNILALPQASFLTPSDCLTVEFLSEHEQIDNVLGTTLSLTTLQRILCCQRPIQLVCTFTNAAMYLECHTGSQRLFTCLPWTRVGGVYWSNYQPYSSLCVFMNSELYATRLHGRAGAQLHVNVKESKSFSLGLNIPSKYYGVDEEITEMVMTMQYRVHGELLIAMEKSIGDEEEAKHSKA